MTHSPLRFSLVIPAFNESESLPELFAWIDRVTTAHALQPFETIVIDDGSRDSTWSTILQQREHYPWLRGIRFRRNYGKSAALQKGFEAATGEVVITLDADLQDSPEEIPSLVQMIREEGWDIVSGWKKQRRDPITKTLPSRLFNAVTRRVSKIPLHDFNCGLKAYRLDVVKNIEVYGEMHRYIPLIAKWAGFSRITEKPVRHQARKYGYSKFGWERVMNGFLDILSIMFVGKFSKRPMHFFGPLGVFSFLAGFGILAYLSWLKIIRDITRISDRPVFFFGIILLLVGVQLFLTGFLAEMISRNNPHRNRYRIAETLGVEVSED